MYQVKHDVHQKFKEALHDRKQLAALHANAPTETERNKEVITDWLSKLKALDGIPFQYLVAGEDMLPPESIRFFYVDPNWVTAVVDGAFSLGTTTYADAAHDTVLAPAVHQQSQALAHQHRAKLLGQKTPLTDSTKGPITGFLLRSMAVSAFPGLEVEGYQGTTKLDILRMEHLSKEILLCLFKGELDTLQIHNPAEGLHFGLDFPDEKKGEEDFKKSLRSMDSEKPEKNGCSIEGSAFSIKKDYYRNDKNVLNIATLAKKLNTTDSPSKFALQMVEGVDMSQLKPRT